MLKDADVLFFFFFFSIFSMGDKKWGMLPGVEWTDAPKDSTERITKWKCLSVSLNIVFYLAFIFLDFSAYFLQYIFSNPLNLDLFTHFCTVNHVSARPVTLCSEAKHRKMLAVQTPSWWTFYGGGARVFFFVINAPENCATLPTGSATGSDLSEIAFGCLKG